MVWTNVNFTTSYITIEDSKIPAEFDHFKMAQVSDLHNQPWGDRLVERLQAEKPDIIVITGDLVDSSHPDFEIASDFLSAAQKIAPVYYVTGNHEAWLGRESQLQKIVMDADVHQMDDTSEWLTKGTAKINLVGIQDPDFTERAVFDGVQEAMMETKLDQLLRQDSYNVVLCHRPEFFDTYVNAQANLVLTGHAHGGQVRIPLIGGLVAPNQGLFPEYTQGVYSRDGTNMVVSRGLGNSVIPVRINNMPELVVITLVSPKARSAN